jgi:starvation-inducible DNA-binding protein
METGMTNEERAAISGGLAKLLADTYVLYVKTQNFHWNIHGPEFYALHLLSEKQYEEMADAVDEIAERIRALGFFVDASMGAFLKLSSIVEEKQVQSKIKFIEELIAGHETILREVRKLANQAEKHNDPGTVDLLGRRVLFHEKAAWMLRSQL